MARSILVLLVIFNMALCMPEPEPEPEVMVKVEVDVDNCDCCWNYGIGPVHIPDSAKITELWETYENGLTNKEIATCEKMANFVYNHLYNWIPEAVKNYIKKIVLMTCEEVAKELCNTSTTVSSGK